MKLLLKTSALVSAYLLLAALGVLLIWPVSELWRVSRVPLWRHADSIARRQARATELWRVPQQAVAAEGAQNPDQVYRYQLDGTLPESVSSQPFSVFISPHHLLADRQMRDGFAYTAATRLKTPTKRIILMGPNHFFRGKAQIITASHNWQTNYGEIQADTDFILTLTERNFAAIEPAIVEQDHAITALLPFVKRFFPDAALVPLLVREPMSADDARTLARFFAQQLGSETLIIVSTDFSHYFPKTVAEEHDKTALAALQTLDFDAFQDAKKTDLDARQVLMIISEFLRLQKAAYFTLLHHTNSADLIGNPYEQSTTSHFVGGYSTGAL